MGFSHHQVKVMVVFFLMVFLFLKNCLIGGGVGAGSTPDKLKSSGPVEKLSKSKSASLFSKPRSSSEARPEARRMSIFSKPRSDSTGAATMSQEVTPATIASFQRAIKPILKTHKVKGQFYPSAFTGKDAVAWVRSNVSGCDSSKAALLFCAALARENAFTVITGKSISDSSSCILKVSKSSV
jgi:hypothetical protein